MARMDSPSTPAAPPLPRTRFHASRRTSPLQIRSYSAWKRRVLLRLAAAYSRRWSSRTLSVGVLGLTAMPSRLPTTPTRPKQGPFPPPGCPGLHRYYGPLGLPSGSARLRLPPYTRGLRPTLAAGEGLSCSAPILRGVPPPIPRGAPASVPEQGRCASPSPRHDRLGAPKHLSADNLTRLKRSPCCGPLLRSLQPRGFRRTARPKGSLPRAGACYRALRRLPGPDFHRLDRCNFHDAP